jgi:hypothetical protein
MLEPGEVRMGSDASSGSIYETAGKGLPITLNLFNRLPKLDELSL